MTEPAYPAARAVAAKVREHFERHFENARRVSESELATQPDSAAIEAITDAAFWASLRREEGFSPKISLAYLPPEQAGQPMIFENPLPLAAHGLTRLAPAVERPGIHLGVWRDANGLCVWGATRTIPRLCFVLEVVAPGLLVIKHRSGQQSGKFVNVAVLEGDEVKVVDPKAPSLADAPPLVISLLGLDSAVPELETVNVLLQLAVSMRAHGRGGSLLVVPAKAETWRDSILRPIPYAVVPPFAALAGLMQENHGEKRPRRWQEALSRAVDAVAGLTAVDGATVITEQFELHAFGAKIIRRNGALLVEQVMVAEPIEGAEPRVIQPALLGGTRHMSAAQFALDQRDAIALVASQDGRFTVFAWSPRREIVMAHRVETLLL